MFTEAKKAKNGHGVEIYLVNLGNKEEIRALKEIFSL